MHGFCIIRESSFLIQLRPGVADGIGSEGEARLETTLEAARKADMPHWEGMCLNARSQLHAARGDEKAARKDLDAALEIFEKLESRLEAGRAPVVRGAEGDAEHARELFEVCGAAVNLHATDADLPSAGST